MQKMKLRYYLCDKPLCIRGPGAKFTKHFRTIL